ncbi:MAG TPA: nucleoside/nucleotide kinase family protein [Jatrophihabitans sp.]|nr:nucleoside/nucleotide kinase family protein [Jatrophihabitans sp.]
MAERIVDELAGRAVLVGMDGFHLADAELVRTGLRDRKGAPETFDRDGFVALLTRLRAAGGTVYAPVFDRRWEDSRAAAVAVPATVPLVVVEGNYLLYWAEVRPLLDEVWYLDPDPVQRRQALIARHVGHGKSPEQARAWVARSDDRNAELVVAGRELADRRIGWSPELSGRPGGQAD